MDYQTFTYRLFHFFKAVLFCWVCCMLVRLWRVHGLVQSQTIGLALSLASTLHFSNLFSDTFPWCKQSFHNDSTFNFIILRVIREECLLNVNWYYNSWCQVECWGKLELLRFQHICIIQIWDESDTDRRTIAGQSRPMREKQRSHWPITEQLYG